MVKALRSGLLVRRTRFPVRRSRCAPTPQIEQRLQSAGPWVRVNSEGPRKGLSSFRHGTVDETPPLGGLRWCTSRSGGPRSTCPDPLVATARSQDLTAAVPESRRRFVAAHRHGEPVPRGSQQPASCQASRHPVAAARDAASVQASPYAPVARGMKRAAGSSQVCPIQAWPNRLTIRDLPPWSRGLGLDASWIAQSVSR